MVLPCLAAAGLRPAVYCIAGFSVAALLVPSTLAASKVSWADVTAAELLETAPRLDRDAPAEVLSWKCEIDDGDFPRERTTTEYVRMKIYDPDRAAQLTRFSSRDNVGQSDETDVVARLTLPDGTTRQFGSDAVKERAFLRAGRGSGFLDRLAGSGELVREKYLAIPGIQRGAVLEYHITRVEQHPGVIFFRAIQRHDLPIRHVEFRCHYPGETSGLFARTFVLHRRNAVASEDKKGLRYTVVADNLPAVPEEPFLGPASDYAMTVLTCYETINKYLDPRAGVAIPARVDPKLGPWAIYATIVNWMERDRGYPTKRVKQLAAEIIANAPNDRAKAVAVHNYVRALYQRTRRLPVPKQPHLPQSLDDVLDSEKPSHVFRQPIEFVWLAVALYQSAGLEAHVIMLPDRQTIRFSEDLVSPAFLQHEAIAVKLRGKWEFSEPQCPVPLPFGLLPWQQQGQPGLLALDHRQEFVLVPVTPSAMSVARHTGTYAIDAAGTLTGESETTLTGHLAISARARLFPLDPPERMRVARSLFGFDPRIVQVSQIELRNIDDPEKPVTVRMQVRWPGFAARTRERLLVRPAVLHVNEKTPFLATERHYPVSYPYCRQELDTATITVPDGFTPESPTVPAPLDAGALYLRVNLAFDRLHHTLHMEREYRSDVIDLPSARYAALRTWYEGTMAANQREVVFVGHNVPMPEILPEQPRSTATDEDEDTAETAMPVDGGPAPDQPRND